MAIETTFQVEGMDCPSCEHRLSKALRKLEGVTKAEANSRTGEVRVTFDQGRAPEAVLGERIEAAGFRVTGSEEATS